MEFGKYSMRQTFWPILILAQSLHTDGAYTKNIFTFKMHFKQFYINISKPIAIKGAI